MNSKVVMETIYGKKNKYEVIKVSKLLGVKFVIYRDGKYHRGEFDSLAEAVEACKREG